MTIEVQKGGRGSGRTHDAIRACVEQAAMGQKVLYVTMGHVGYYRDIALKITAEMGLVGVTYKKSKQRLEFPGDGFLDLRAHDPSDKYLKVEAETRGKKVVYDHAI
jgi:hypothetical protein